MEYQRFLENLPRFYESWEQSSLCPVSDRFHQILEKLDKVQAMTTPNLMQLLNFAIECLEDNEIYCEVGCGHGANLIGALTENPETKAYAIDYFSDFANQLNRLTNNLNLFGLTEQIFFYNQDCEEFFLELREFNVEERIGVYFYNSSRDYRSQLMGLLLVKQFLAEKAIIVIGGSKSDSVQQAIWDFIEAQPQCKLLFDLPTIKEGNTSFWDGVKVLSWDAKSTHNYDWLALQEQRNRTSTIIYILCPDNAAPAGGVKQLYRHVDILNKHGFSASILHQQVGFRCSWFPNHTRINYFSSTEIKKTDYLVIPEIYGLNIDHLFPGVKKVIFNQNTYYTFGGYSFAAENMNTPYLHREVVATIVVSEDNQQYINYVFPRLNCFRLHYGFNHQIFFFNDAIQKKRQICFMPRKHGEDALQVINILKFRNLLKDFEIALIENKTESEVAEIMRESLIFLSFGYPEGFGMPPAEAMACGCIVVGYHGGGGREYFKPEFSYPIKIGEIVEFAKKVEQVMEQYRNDAAFIKEKAKNASKYILSEYSLEREEIDVVEIWKNILNREKKYL